MRWALVVVCICMCLPTASASSVDVPELQQVSPAVATRFNATASFSCADLLPRADPSGFVEYSVEVTSLAQVWGAGNQLVAVACAGDHAALRNESVLLTVEPPEGRVPGLTPIPINVTVVLPARAAAPEIRITGRGSLSFASFLRVGGQQVAINAPSAGRPFDVPVAWESNVPLRVTFDPLPVGFYPGSPAPQEAGTLRPPDGIMVAAHPYLADAILGPWTFSAPEGNGYEVHMFRVRAFALDGSEVAAVAGPNEAGALITYNVPAKTSPSLGPLVATVTLLAALLTRRRRSSTT